MHSLGPLVSFSLTTCLLLRRGRDDILKHLFSIHINNHYKINSLQGLCAVKSAGLSDPYVALKLIPDLKSVRARKEKKKILPHRFEFTSFRTDADIRNRNSLL